MIQSKLNCWGRRNSSLGWWSTIGLFSTYLELSPEFLLTDILNLGRRKQRLPRWKPYSIWLFDQAENPHVWESPDLENKLACHFYEPDEMLYPGFLLWKTRYRLEDIRLTEKKCSMISQLVDNIERSLLRNIHWLIISMITYRRSHRGLQPSTRLRNSYWTGRQLHWRVWMHIGR